jgi:hypothetical protein
MACSAAGALAVLLASCGDDAIAREGPADVASTNPGASSGSAVPTTTTPAATPPTTTATVPLADALCSAGDPVQLGALGAADLDELSGLAVSPRTPGVLWAVEDSGNDAAVFALDATGAEVARLDVDARNIDWEDVSSGADGALYVGDIGDNLRVRDAVTVYVVETPDDPAAAPVPLRASAVTVRYPDGPHDAEALFADPVDGSLYVVTKALDQRTTTLERESIVFRIDPDAGEDVDAQEVARLQLGALQLVTAADLSSDGTTIALRTYTSILLWSRRPGESVADAFAREPCVRPGPPDRIGESLAFLADGSLVTSSEGSGAPLYGIRPLAG